MIEIKGYEIPNTLEELTVEQFDKLNDLNSSSQDTIDKWIGKFVYLGVPEEVFDEMTLDEFKENVRIFNEGDTEPKERELRVEVDGFVYIAKEVISAKDLSLIEKAWKVSRSEFSADCLSILFKREDLSRTEHYAPSHIKHKKALFKKLPSRVGIPHVLEVSKLLIRSIENITEENATADVE